MNMRFIKKFLAVTLAASLMIAPAVTAGATTDSSEPTSSDSTAPSESVTPSDSTKPSETVTPSDSTKPSESEKASDSTKTQESSSSSEDTSSSDAQQSSSSSSDSGSTTVAPAVVSTSSVPGVGKSTVSGAFSLKKLPGVAVKASTAEIGKQVALATNEKLFARVYEIDQNGSPKAFESINKAIESVGGTYIGAVNFDLGKMTGTNFAELPEGIEIPVAFGVPKEYQGKKIGVVRVEKLGKTTIFEDQDDNPASVTAPVTSRLAAYALFAH